MCWSCQVALVSNQSVHIQSRFAPPHFFLSLASGPHESEQISINNDVNYFNTHVTKNASLEEEAQKEQFEQPTVALPSLSTSQTAPRTPSTIDSDKDNLEESPNKTRNGLGLGRRA